MNKCETNPAQQRLLITRSSVIILYQNFRVCFFSFIVGIFSLKKKIRVPPFLKGKCLCAFVEQIAAVCLLKNYLF